jgi:hypothetical protein
VASAVEGEVQVLQDIHASQEDKGLVVRERDVSELYLSGHDRVDADVSMSLRGLSNYCSKSGFFVNKITFLMLYLMIRSVLVAWLNCFLDV